MKIETWVWKKTSKKWNEYFFGVDKDTNMKVVLFHNQSENEKAPDFNVIIEEMEDVDWPDFL